VLEGCASVESISAGRMYSAHEAPVRRPPSDKCMIRLAPESRGAQDRFTPRPLSTASCPRFVRRVARVSQDGGTRWHCTSRSGGA